MNAIWVSILRNINLDSSIGTEAYNKMVVSVECFQLSIIQYTYFLIVVTITKYKNEWYGFGFIVHFYNNQLNIENIWVRVPFEKYKSAFATF